MTGRSQSIARGFLFADLRGYSAYVERHGDRAGADLLIRYRDLVRATVREFDGAEIRTEGDSFYLAFDSPSAAIRCGLAILDAAAGEPDASTDPIAVGIGVHAGETVELDEGYVGSAVNIAARVCAQAKVGELLATDAVRALTRTYLDVTFEPAGRRRLKGIGEPMAVYRVLPPGAVPTRRPVVSGRWAVAVGVLLGIAVVTLAGSALMAGDPGAGLTGDLTSPSVAPSALASATEAGPATPSEPAAPTFPTAAEAANLALVAASRRSNCGPASPEDGPRFRDVGGLPHGAPAPWAYMSTYGGIHCALGGLTAPDSVWIWELGQLTNPSAPRNAAEWMTTHAAHAGAAPGTCSPDAAPALETWEFSGRRGQLLCVFTVTGDAIVYWTYAGRNVLGKALRDDRNMVELLEWWRAEARFAGG